MTLTLPKLWRTVLKRFFYGVVGCVLTLGLSIGWAQGQDYDEYGDEYYPDEYYEDYQQTGNFSIYFDDKDSVYTSLSFYQSDASLETAPAKIEQVDLQTAVEQSLGCALQSVDLWDEDPEYVSFSGECDLSLTTQQFYQYGQIELTPILETLAPLEIQSLSVVVTLPDGVPVRLNPPSDHDAATLGWWSLFNQGFHQYNVAVQQPEIVTLTLQVGYSLSSIVSRASLLVMILLLPLGCIFWMRQRALAAAVSAAVGESEDESDGDDTAPIWFSFQRAMFWVTTGLWLLWIGVFYGSDATQWLPLLLGYDGGLTQLFNQSLFFGPPIVVTWGCYALAHRVYQQVGQLDYTLRELLLQVMVTQAAIYVPLLSVIFAGPAILSGQYGLGLGLIAIALLCRITLFPWVQKLRDITPHAVTTGDLRDRIFALAKPAGVKLNQIYVLPMKRSRMVNAFAVKGGTVMLTDYLLQNLSKAEVDGVMAHELAHLQYGHPKKLGFTLILGIVVGVILGGVLMLPLSVIVGEAAYGLWIMLGSLFGLAAFFATSRRFEYQADGQAALLTGDPRSLMTGLVKVARLNQMPLEWGRWSESFMTHPSMRRRLDSLAQRYDISADEVSTLLEPSAKPTNAYTVPVAEHQPVFSSQVKQRILQRLSWALMACFTLVPAGVARCAQLAGLPEWGAYGVGIAIALGLYAYVINAGPLWGFDGLQRQLAQRLESEGLTPDQGQFVGFAPDAEPRQYEGFTTWDLGYLFWTDNAVCYVGEETQFALTREQIVSLHLRTHRLGWVPTPKLYLTWQVGNQTGTFNFQPMAQGRLTQMPSQAQALHQQLQQWLSLAQSDAGQAVDLVATSEIDLKMRSALQALQPPALGDVTSRAIGSLSTAKAFLNYGLVLMALGFIATGLTGLLTNPNNFIYVILLSLLGSVIQFLPFWRRTEG